MTSYPRDTVLSYDEKHGTVNVRPSGETGTRIGIAPDGTTEVVVVDGGGEVLETARVERGLYKVSVPPQATDASVVFRAGSDVLARRPAAG